MDYNKNMYVLGLWFVHGYILTEEYDIQVVVHRKTEKDPWEIEMRTRHYKDNNMNGYFTKDKKTWYDIKPGDHAFASEDFMINHIDSLTKNFANGMIDGFQDKIIGKTDGQSFVTVIVNANKEWLQIKAYKINEDGTQGPAIPIPDEVKNPKP